MPDPPTDDPTDPDTDSTDGDDAGDSDDPRQMSSREYADTVVRPWLAMEYGHANVDQDVELAASYRVVDFVVEAPLATWAIMVEPIPGRVTAAIGQALLAAAHRPRWRPCIVIPPGHLPQPERDMLDDHVRIIELPPDTSVVLAPDYAADGGHTPPPRDHAGDADADDSRWVDPEV